MSHMSTLDIEISEHPERFDDDGEWLQRTRTLDGRWLAAVRKARQTKTRAYKLSDSAYAVKSSRDGATPYFVSQTGFGCPGADGWECGCQAGWAGVPCYHLAAVLMSVARRARRTGVNHNLPERGGELFSEPDEAPSKSRLEQIWDRLS